VKFSHLKEIPTGFLYSNVIVIAIYTIGVMAATYASALHPAVARTAALLSNIVNGVATILISLVVDPRIATITDQAVADERPRHHATVMAVFLIASMFLGTLLSQAIFIPAAHLIGWVAELIRKIFGS
jgi:chromate transport protein ChrA